jgi:hypothetical protein
MTDCPVPTDDRMMAAANLPPQGGTAAARPATVNLCLRPRVIERPPAPPRQAMIRMSGNIAVPPLQIPTKCKEQIDMAVVPGEIWTEIRQPAKDMAPIAQLG